MTDLQQYLVDEFVEDYQEGQMTRRDAMRRIAAVTGSLVVANSILAACAAPPSASTINPDQSSTAPAPASSVNADDRQLEAGMVQIPEQDATLLAYQARPQGDGPFPIVLVCHENRGLTEHIKDVTRRLAKAGYVALAVDMLSRQGGTDKIADPAQVPGTLGNASPEQLVGDFQSGLRYLQQQPYAHKERAGMVGFCFGGGVTWRCATKMPELRAAVPFYGPHPPLEDVPGIQAAVRAIYAEQDQRINQGIPAIEEAMRQNNKVFEKIIYPNASHAFHNDTGRNYNPDAARDAWAKTLEWFGQYLQD